MIENNGRKLKSVFVVLAMLLTAFTISMFVVSARPNAFSLTAPPTNGTYYELGRTIHLTWGTSNTTFTNYSVYINGTRVANNISGLSYNWVTTNLTNDHIGAYKITVIAFASQAGVTTTRKYAQNGNITVYLTAGIPGRDIWQGGKYDVTGTKNVTKLYGSQDKGQVLNTSTVGLKYGATVAIQINGSAGKGWGAGPYYLYYPTYTYDGVGYSYSWALYNPVGDPAPSFAKPDWYLGESGEAAVTFNRSGIWIIDDTYPTTDANMSTLALTNATVPAWFWVNGSGDLTVSSDISTTTYGAKPYITISSTKAGAPEAAVVDVRAFSNNQTIFDKNKWTGSSGVFPFYGEPVNFTHVGTYEVYAYKDMVGTSAYAYYWQDQNPKYYDNNYGNGTITYVAVGPYNYALCGPWDPPEYIQATKDTITVSTGRPTITLTNTSSNIYWGFAARVDINVTNPATGKGLTGGADKISIKNVEGDYIDWQHAENGTAGSYAITNLGNGNYSFNISRGAAFWKNLYTTYCNGTWRVFYSYDADSDGEYEWNYSAAFHVGSTAPSARIVMDDDGNGTKTDNKVDVPTYTGAGVGPANALTVLFTIYGDTVTGVHTDYYGDDAWENSKNISITGDILYPATLTYVANGQWNARLTPTKPGGTINIEVDWNTTNTVLTETINIVNGSTVTTSTDVIYAGENTDLIVYVKDMDGDPVKTAEVYLFEKGLGAIAINSTTGIPAEGNGNDGAYTFRILSTNFTAAPDNITIAAKWATGRWGYTNVKVEKQHNMIVNVTPITSYAGDDTEYTIAVSLVGGGHPEEDATFNIKLYNEAGALVTGTDAWAMDTNYEQTEVKALSGGTYHLYAYNDTHDSTGNNATLVITKYQVTSSPSVLAWKIDEAVNMTFQVTPAGNGTLLIENMSSLPNCSFLNQDTQINIEDGVGTLDEVNATTLGNVTFSYTPEDGEERCADGLLRVTTANATPSPATIYIYEATSVTITITHPATGAVLSGVEVGLDLDLNSTTTILSKLPTNKFTDAQGEVTFAITAETDGNVTIFIENETDPDNEFVIVAAARKTMEISTDVPAVDEGATFTVEAKSGGALITDATVTITFAGATYTTTTGTTTPITAPAVKASLDYTITATAEGYSDDTATIKVLNVPKLTIIPPSGKVYGTKEFTVVVAEDSGNAVIGAKVTFNGADYYTGAGGSVTLTAPDVKETSKDYTLTATFTGFESASTATLTIYKTQGGIPGFELVTLIAAIGVALILLRRRRN